MLRWWMSWKFIRSLERSSAMMMNGKVDDASKISEEIDEFKFQYFTLIPLSTFALYKSQELQRVRSVSITRSADDKLTREWRRSFRGNISFIHSWVFDGNLFEYPAICSLMYSINILTPEISTSLSSSDVECEEWKSFRARERVRWTSSLRLNVVGRWSSKTCSSIRDGGERALTMGNFRVLFFNIVHDMNLYILWASSEQNNIFYPLLPTRTQSNMKSWNVSC